MHESICRGGRRCLSLALVMTCGLFGAVAQAQTTEAQKTEAQTTEAKKIDPFHKKNKSRTAVMGLGDWALSFDLQVRPRFLADAGRDFTDSDSANTRVTQRARFGATASHKDGWAARVVVQDVRAWGEALNTLNDFSAEGLDVQEAYFRVPIAESIQLYLGRQEINFDNQRILGAVGWSQRARALDGARLVGRYGAAELQLLYARLSQKALPFEPDATIPADRTSNSDFVAGHLAYKLGPWLNANFSYYLIENRPAELTRHTVGTYLNGKADILRYTGELYFQFGSLPSGETSADIEAWMGALQAGIALESGFEILGRIEYLSGSGTPESAFDPFFGTNHKFYGEADYFLVMPGAALGTAGNGLIDAGGVVKYSGFKGVALSIDTHIFSTTNAVSVGEEEHSFLGVEIDFKVTYRPSPFFRITALYAPIIPGEAIRLQPRVPDDPNVDLQLEHFGYVTAELKI